MVVCNWHIGNVASLRDAGEVLIIRHRTALRLYGVIKIKPLRGFSPVRCLLHKVAGAASSTLSFRNFVNLFRLRREC